MFDLLAGDHNQEKFAALDQVLAKYQNQSGQLIKILHEAQHIFGYLPEEVQAYISEKTNIPVSTVNGVVTFYALFSTEPKGKYHINVCLGTACYVQGARKIYERLRSELGLTDRDITPDGLFSVQNTRCIGACGLAPVLTVNADVHGRMSVKDVPRLLQQYREQAEGGESFAGKHVDRLGTDQEPAPAGH